MKRLETLVKTPVKVNVKGELLKTFNAIYATTGVINAVVSSLYVCRVLHTHVIQPFVGTFVCKCLHVFFLVA